MNLWFRFCCIVLSNVWSSVRSPSMQDSPRSALFGSPAEMVCRLSLLLNHVPIEINVLMPVFAASASRGIDVSHICSLGFGFPPRRWCGIWQSYHQLGCPFPRQKEGKFFVDAIVGYAGAASSSSFAVRFRVTQRSRVSAIWRCFTSCGILSRSAIFVCVIVLCHSKSLRLLLYKVYVGCRLPLPSTVSYYKEYVIFAL